jgi:hypothetical protein
MNDSGPPGDWTLTFPGQAVRLAQDSEGHLFVAYDHDGGAAIIKVDATSARTMWREEIAGPSWLTAVAFDQASVYVTGTAASGKTLSIGHQSISLPSIDSMYATASFIARLDAVTGETIWLTSPDNERVPHGGDGSRCLDVAARGDRVVMICGYFGARFGIDSHFLPPQGTLALLALSSSGSLVWSVGFTGDAYGKHFEVFHRTIAIDDSGAVWFGGLLENHEELIDVTHAKTILSANPMNALPYIARVDDLSQVVSNGRTLPFSGGGDPGNAQSPLLTFGSTAMFVVGDFDTGTYAMRIDSSNASTIWTSTASTNHLQATSDSRGGLIVVTSYSSNERLGTLPLPPLSSGMSGLALARLDSNGIASEARVIVRGTTYPDADVAYVSDVAYVLGTVGRDARFDDQTTAAIAEKAVFLARRGGQR